MELRTRLEQKKAAYKQRYAEAQNGMYLYGGCIDYAHWKATAEVYKTIIDEVNELLS